MIFNVFYWFLMICCDLYKLGADGCQPRRVFCFRQTNDLYIFWSPILIFWRFFHKNHWFYENKKESWRNSGHFSGSSAFVSLLCVRIERIWLLSNNLIFGDGDDDGGGGRISGRGPGPYPIALRDQISRSGTSPHSDLIPGCDGIGAWTLARNSSAAAVAAVVVVVAVTKNEVIWQKPNPFDSDT